MSESLEADEGLPAIAGIYVELERYRRLTTLEQQVRMLFATLNEGLLPEEIGEAVRLALAKDDTAEEVSMLLDTRSWELYRALAALIEASGWRLPYG